MKNTLNITISAGSSLILTAFGGWDTSLTTLLIFMSLDYALGLICAGVFGVSQKTEGGGLSSRECWKGLVRKGITLLIVLVACRLDILLNTTFVRDCVIISFVLNETISIIENAALIGVPIPSAIEKALELLKEKEVKKDGEVSR